MLVNHTEKSRMFRRILQLKENKAKERNGKGIDNQNFSQMFHFPTDSILLSIKASNHSTNFPLHCHIKENRITLLKKT